MLTEALSAYLPIDRCQAIARGESLPDRAHGAALFADVSGFTALTDALAQELGAQRGAEEISRQLNQVFDALAAEISRYRGSVLSFSGDAFTCWFDDRGAGGEELEPATARAATCALAIQAAMRPFASVITPAGTAVRLSVKVAVAAGPTRRFQVGDPDIQLIDVLAGATLERLAATEHLAMPGEVVLSHEVAAALGDALEVRGLRGGPASGLQAPAAVVAGTRRAARPAPWPPLPHAALREEQLRPWLLQPVYERLSSGQGQFLGELRPVSVLFTSFSGIDYDGDPAAHERLDAYVRWAQRTVTRYGGTLLQLTIGDKGSSFYCSFGAPSAHEDDARRASLAALALRAPGPELAYIQETRVGVAIGPTYSGAYGATARCTYGVLGSQVNTAARLMQAAGAGEVLTGSHVQKAAGEGLRWEQLEPIMVKGRAAPVQVYRLGGVDDRRPPPTPISSAMLPMVGRAAELARIGGLLDRTLAREGQLIAITAPAGVGKSRLVAEAVRLAHDRRMALHYGGCESYATSDSYFAWGAIWHSFFDLDPAATPEARAAALAARVEALDPALAPRLPLLGALLGLPIPDNDLTRSFDAKVRKEALESLLVSCVRLRARQRPLLIVLEDAHWLDPLSHDLLVSIGLAIADVAAGMVVAYRPPEADQRPIPQVAELPNCTVLELADLSADESAELVGLKQVHLNAPGALPPEVVAQIVERAQGNPFYIEEVLNYLHDRGLAPQTAQELEQSQLPDSLTSLILSRIDRLSEHQRTTLKVASVIGRLFRSAWLAGFYPDLGDASLVQRELDMLCSAEMVLQEQPEPEDAYQFRHIVTHGVAYDSLTYEARARLHERLGGFIEQTFPDAAEQFVHLLAFHYDISLNEAKRRRYLRLAGEAAQAAFSNTAAIDYYQRVLPLLDERETGPVHFRLGQVQELVGEWEQAGRSYQAALERAAQAGDSASEVACLLAIGGLSRKQSRYDDALGWLARARDRARAIGDDAGLVQALADMGETYRLQGNYAAAALQYGESKLVPEPAEPSAAFLAARANALKGEGSLANQQGDPERARLRTEEALAIRRALGHRHAAGALLNNLGMAALSLGQHASAQPLFEEGLAIFREVGDRYAIGALLNNLGMNARYLGRTAAGRASLEEAIALRRNLGDRWGVASSLSTLTNLLLHSGETAGMRPMLEESLLINEQVGDLTALAYSLEDFAGYFAAEGEHERALHVAGGSAALRERLGAPLSPTEQADLDRLLARSRTALGPAAEAHWSAGRATGERQAADLALGRTGDEGLGTRG